MKLTLPEEPVALEWASVRGVRAAFHWFSVMPGHVRSLPSLLTHNDVELHVFTFTHASFDHVRVVPAAVVWWTKMPSRVVAINESVALLDAEQFNPLNHLLVLATAFIDKAVQGVTEFAPLQLTVSFSSLRR